MDIIDFHDRALRSLLAKVAESDEDALAEIFRAEAGRLIAIARRIVRRPELAEEVVQDAFVTIWQRAATFDPARGAARAWMTTIVRNKALNVLRDSARLEFEDPLELNQRGLDVDNAFALLPETEALKSCLQGLEPKRRRCILLAYVVGLTHGEIAAEAKAPVGTVKAWIRRGMIALQECLS